MKQLERLLFLQGHRCFFCGEAIPEGEASIEHLVATSLGGAKSDENCIVCCKAVNAALGNTSVKAKLQAVLNQRGRFVCPASTDPQTAPSETGFSDSLKARVTLVVGDLRKRGTARPRRIATLKNTMNAAFQMKLSEEELDALLVELKSKGYVAVDDEKVSYALPAAGA
jgi:hypothetical protein